MTDPWHNIPYPLITLPGERPDAADGKLVYLSPDWFARVQGLIRILELRDTWEDMSDAQYIQIYDDVLWLESEATAVYEDTRYAAGILEKKFTDTGWLSVVDLETLFGGGAGAGAIVKQLTPQTFTTAVTDGIDMDSEDTDTDNYWDAGAPDRFTVPLDRAGLHLVGLSFYWEGSAAGRRFCWLQHEANYIYRDERLPPSQPSPLSCGGLVNLAEGDEVKFLARQTSGGDLDIVTTDAEPTAFIIRIGGEGAQGATGDVGEQGSQGDTGAPGATGAQGETGETGGEGSEGEQGEQGVAGTNWVQPIDQTIVENTRGHVWAGSEGAFNWFRSMFDSGLADMQLVALDLKTFADAMLALFTFGAIDVTPVDDIIDWFYGVEKLLLTDIRNELANVQWREDRTCELYMRLRDNGWELNEEIYDAWISDIRDASTDILINLGNFLDALISYEAFKNRYVVYKTDESLVGRDTCEESISYYPETPYWSVEGGTHRDSPARVEVTGNTLFDVRWNITEDVYLRLRHRTFDINPGPGGSWLNGAIKAYNNGALIATLASFRTFFAAPSTDHTQQGGGFGPPPPGTDEVRFTYQMESPTAVLLTEYGMWVDWDWIEP